jgi:hypothetical protein
MDDDLPMGTSQDVFYFTEGALAHAGYYLHAEDNPLHTHSFVKIAFAGGGAGTHHCVAGRRELGAGMSSSCSGPASGTGTCAASSWSCANCCCCFSSELS